MFVLDSVAVTDDFPADGSSGGAQIITVNGGNGGFASVAANDVYVQIAYSPSGLGMLSWTPQVRVGVGNIILQPGTRGIRFRNATAGAAAIVSAALSEPAEPALQLTAGGVASGARVQSLAYAAASSVNTPLTQAWLPVPGCSINFTINGQAAQVGINFTLDFAPTVGGFVGANGVTFLDGNQTGLVAVFIEGAERGTYGQLHLISPIAKGPHTIDLRAVKLAAGGVVAVDENTSLLLTIIDQ